MAAKRYSAGAIFLQVVPVFGNVQKAIEAHAKDIDRALGDRMEKAGKKAGERAGKAAAQEVGEELARASGQFERDFRKNVDGINGALEGINVKKLSNAMRRELTEVKRELAGLKDVDMTIEPNMRRAYAELAVLEGRLLGLRDNSKIVFRADIDQALKGMSKIAAAKEAIDDPIEIEISTDFKGALREMTSFEKTFKKVAERAASHLSGSMNKEVIRIKQDLRALQDLRIGVDISANQARRELAELMAEVNFISKNDVDIDVRVDSARAFAELFAFDIALKKIDGQTAKAKVRVDGSNQAAEDAVAASTAFRSFNIVLLASAAIGPALIPVLAGLAAGLLALAPAAAVAAFGIGAVIVGFSGIGDALQALQARQDQAGKTAQAAGKQQASAARAVERAQQSAARAVESALDAQTRAQKRYKDSIEDVRDAEKKLAEERAEHAGDGKDLERQIRENQLAIDSGVLGVFDATVNFNAVMGDGSSTNADKERARIELEQARLALEELRETQKDLARDKKKWDKEGVNGTDAVKSAQDRLAEAIESQKESYKDLGDAAEAVDRARADGAQNVADAIAAQADALSAVNTQQANVDAAFDKLGISGKRFSLFLFGLKKGFRDFRDDIQEVMLPGIQRAIEGFLGSANGKIARDALIGLAASFSRFVEALSVSFQGQAWQGFFQMLADLGPRIQELFGTAFISFLEALASILTAMAPFAVKFAEGLAEMMIQFAAWAASPEGQEMIQDFMTFLFKYGPATLEFLFTLVAAFGNIVEALAPWGAVVLDVLTRFLDIIATMDPKVLGGILAAIIVLTVASQLAYLAMQTVLAGTALLGSTTAIVVFALVGIGAALAFLYSQNKGFRDFVDKAWKDISKAFTKAWDDIKPALDDLFAAIGELWGTLEPFFAFLGKAVIFYITTLLPIMAKIWATQIRIMAAVIRFVLLPIIGAIGTALTWVWEKVLRPTFDFIGKGWGKLADGMKWVWEHVLKPVFSFIADDALPALETAFHNTIDAIGAIWKTLRRIVATPINFIIGTVLNDGLIAGFNKVASFVGLDGIPKIPIPKGIQKYSYATGGIMPGYTPGRDVHSFMSPTAGRLELSGGEAVMRPEWTAAIGPQMVNHWNRLARTGGVKAIRDSLGGGMGGFWNGGILPLPGGRFKRHEKGYPGFAGDLNWGSGRDDYGRRVEAWKAGVVAQQNFIGDRSYGRWTVLNHPGGENSLYAHLSKFGGFGVGDKVKAGQTIGYVGDIGNTGTPPGPHLHFEINNGLKNYQDISTGGGRKSIPGWLLSLVKDPLGAVKNWITKPWDKLSDAAGESQMLDTVKKVPGRLAKATVDKMWGIIPGWVKTAAGWAGDAADWVVGGVKNVGGAAADLAGDVGSGIKNGAGAVGDFLGLFNGGILPYNGTMKYDAGGYLPPGLTNVVNLTGRPEPVFTGEQWDNMGDGAGGEGIHYEPHFEGSNLTPDDVMGDFNFTVRRLRRSGRYGKAGS